MARRLREVAEGLGAVGLRLGDHAVTPASTVKFEEEYSAETIDEGITFELELELKWRSSSAEGRGTSELRLTSRSEDGRGGGKFELFKDVGDKFRFRLKAGNGQIIASSDAYETKAAAQNGIKSVQTNAPTAGSTIRPERA